MNNTLICECGTQTPCCWGRTVEPIDPETSQDLAAGFAAIGDPTRVEILHILSVAGEPVCVVDVERHLPLSQSTVSYHLDVLLKAGLLDRDRRTKWSYYTIRRDGVRRLQEALEEIGTRAEGQAVSR